MRVLAIETATPLASCALVDETGLLAETVIRAPMRHLEWLLPAVQEMLGHLGLAADTVEGLAVSCGPGGFTGLRIGIATAVAWAKARTLPAAGVGTLEALARVPGVEGLVLPALDAHRGEVAAALYRVRADGGAECLVPPLVAPPAAIAAETAAHAGPVLLCGDALTPYGAALAAALGPRARLGAGHLHPRAAAVGFVGRARLLRGECAPLTSLLPVYGRRPVAWPRKEPTSRGGKPKVIW